MIGQKDPSGHEEPLSTAQRIEAPRQTRKVAVSEILGTRQQFHG